MSAYVMASSYAENVLCYCYRDTTWRIRRICRQRGQEFSRSNLLTFSGTKQQQNRTQPDGISRPRTFTASRPGFAVLQSLSTSFPQRPAIGIISWRTRQWNPHHASKESQHLLGLCLFGCSLVPLCACAWIPHSQKGASRLSSRHSHGWRLHNLFGLYFQHSIYTVHSTRQGPPLAYLDWSHRYDFRLGKFWIWSILCVVALQKDPSSSRVFHWHYGGRHCTDPDAMVGLSCHSAIF